MFYDYYGGWGKFLGLPQVVMYTYIPNSIIYDYIKNEGEGIILEAKVISAETLPLEVKQIESGDDIKIP